MSLLLSSRLLRPQEYADALLVIPKTLAVNAAQDATELVAKLCAFHHAAQSVSADGSSGAGGHGSEGSSGAAEDGGANASAKADFRFMGLDLIKGKVRIREGFEMCLICHIVQPFALSPARPPSVCVVYGAVDGTTHPQCINHCAFTPIEPRSQVVNNLARGVVEPALSKVKSLRFATEAAITILRIDDFIKISPPQGGGR